MAKVKTKFICQNCNTSYPKWVGKCENCGSWNTLVEEIIEDNKGKNAIAKSEGMGKRIISYGLDEVILGDSQERISTGFGELDLVLGGGILPAGVILIAGQPGIGKSTLLMQICGFACKNHKILYISGEESASQVALRSKRLGVYNTGLKFASSTSADDIAETINTDNFNLVIIDSIQTLAMKEVSSASGTVSQITNSSNLIMNAAKKNNTAVILVGHITKEGSIAGPKTLEHMVDVVLNFEGDRYGGFKVVRAVKNRYGSTSEAAIFEMDNNGLKIVKNPSQALLAERQNTDGSIIMATLEGGRPLLVEVQALVTKSSFGYPKRTVSGFDLNRLNLLVAVLNQRTKLDLSDKDIFVNVVGGLKLNDHASDLAICMAIASAAAGRKLDDGVVVFGEVGLSGEIRIAKQTDKRVQEAKKLGFTKAIAPAHKDSKDQFIKPVKDLREALIKYLQ